MTDDDARVTLFWEGVDTSDGRRIEPGAVTWDDEPFPITRHGSLTRSDGNDLPSLYGKGLDVRREENGRVTCRVDPPLPKGHHLAVELGDVHVNERDLDGVFSHTLVIVQARLRGAAVVAPLHAVWPDQLEGHDARANESP
jgi:hypothetical protein